MLFHHAQMAWWDCQLIASSQSLSPDYPERPHCAAISCSSPPVWRRAGVTLTPRPTRASRVGYLCRTEVVCVQELHWLGCLRAVCSWDVP